MPRIALCSIDPRIVQGRYSPFSLGIRQLQATIMMDASLSDWEVVRVEDLSMDVEHWVERILAAKADIVGLSVYVWSFPTFTAVASRLRHVSPKTRIILGGPCARPIMFELPRYRGLQRDVDAVIAGEGEWLMAPLLKQRDWDVNALSRMPGVHVATRDGWRSGGIPAADQPLDDLASAVLCNLVEFDRTVTVERYRGCPMSCTFCQWGDQTTPHRVFGEERMRLELQALKDRGTPSLQLVDAGLNLNARAFKNFANAEKAVGLLKTATLHACVYPSYLTDEHLEFIAGCTRPVLDLGVQTFTPSALEMMNRPFRMERLERVVEELNKVSDVQAELILGLPGDNPESFKKSVLRMLEMECNVRVFHCLALPDALMSRQTPEQQLRFDPESFMVTSCLGWSEDDLRKTRVWLEDLTMRVGGESDHNTWAFYNSEQGAQSLSPQLQPIIEIWSDVRTELAPVVREATSGAWSLAEMGQARRSTRARLVGDGLNLQVDFVPEAEAKLSYRSAGGVAVSHRALNETPLTGPALKQFDLLLDTLLPAVAPYVLQRVGLATPAPIVPYDRPQQVTPELRTTTIDTVAIPTAIPRLDAPTLAAFHSAWERASCMILERLVPADVCAALIATLDGHVTRAAQSEASANWPQGFADRLRASASAIVPFWDPTVSAEKPPVDRLLRLGHQLQQIPEVAALLRRPEVAGSIGALLKTPVLVSVVLIDKVPGGSAQFGMHQDSWYLHGEPETLLSVQIALDDAEEDNGCLRLLPTRRDEVVTCRAELTADGWQEGPAVHAPPAPESAQVAAMPRGSVLLYDGRTWHWSPLNTSRRHRRVIVAQFMDASSTWAADNWLPAPPDGFPRWP